MPRSVVLRREGGKRVAEILHGKVGERVDLHRRGKGRHGHCAEAVDKPLDEKDTKIHRRLLRAGKKRQIKNLREHRAAECTIVLPRQELAAFQNCVDENSDS